MILRRPHALLLAAVPTLVALLWVATALAAPAAVPVTPHPLEGRSDCLVCHGPTGPKPAPADHAGRTSATCLACHPVAAAAPATPLPTQAPAATPPPAATTAPAATQPAVPATQPANPTPLPATPSPAATAMAAPAAPTASPAATEAPAPPVQPAAQATAPAGKNDTCLACHKNAGPTMAFADGQKVPVAADAATFEASVHGSQGVACVDCHTDISGYPHPQPSAQTYRDYALNADQLCQKCHSDNYHAAQDSVHGRLIASGNKTAPSCTDCHGAHDVAPPDQPRQRISRTCAKCHDSIYQDYAASVHGSALINEANTDVPVCTDCHGVHNIPDPRTAEFRIESPDLCAKCHGDEQKMAKYGLSSKVTATYQKEFHGITATIYKTNYPTVWCYKAVCTDCHAVHDIRKPSDPASSVFSANLPATCSKCHPGAAANFAGAWIGHYEPSTSSSPLVYYINLFYQIVIPLIVVSLLSFIVLEIIHRLRLRFGRGQRG